MSEEVRLFEIELPSELRELIESPPCFVLPKPDVPTLQLPSGGSLKAIADITKGIPDECSLTFNLAAQLPPLLVNLECIVRILQVIVKLKEVLEAFPDPGKVAQKVPEFVKTVNDLAPCIAMIAGIPPFIKDILCLLIKLLRCVVDGLRTVVDVMNGLQLELDLLGKNDERRAVIECAMKNQMATAAYTMNALETLLLILKLAEPLMQIGGVEPIQIPTVGSAEDVESLEEVISTLEVVLEVLTAAADALGGC
jgi:hypothetical protein